MEAKADEARAVAEAQVAIAIARAVSEVEPLAQAQVLIKQAEQELIVARVSPQAPAIPLSLDAHRHAFDIPSFPPQRARAAYPSAAYPSVGATPPTSTPPTSTPPSCGAAPRALIHFTRKTCHRFLPEIPFQQIDHPPNPTTIPIIPRPDVTVRVQQSNPALSPLQAPHPASYRITDPRPQRRNFSSPPLTTNTHPHRLPHQPRRCLSRSPPL